MTIERINAKPTRWTTLLGLILVPVLVAGGLLWANWNDNERLRTVQAAVVNLDEAVTIAGEYIPLGRQLTAALVDSDRVQNLNWELASEEGARQGIATGEFAAMVTIPKGFSKAATSYSGDAADATSATVQVETSPVAGIADATLGKVVAQEAARVLNETLTAAYLDQIYIGFNDMGEQFVTIADGAAELADGAEQLADGMKQAADGSVELADGTAELANGLGTMAEQTASMPKATRALADGTKELSDGVAVYVDGVNQLVDQTLGSLDQQAQLVTGVRQLAQGAGGLSGGLSTYQDTLNANADNAAAGAGQIQALLAGLAGGGVTPAQVTTAIQAACPGVPTTDLSVAGPTCVAALQATAAALSQAADGLSQTDPSTNQSLLSGAAALADGLGELSTELGSAGGEDPTKELKQLKAGGKELASGTAELAKGTDQLADSIPQLTDGIAQTADGASQLAEGTDGLSEGLADIADGGAQLAEGARELADGLNEGKDQLPSYSASDRETLSAVVATPISTTNLTGTAGFGVGWVTLLMVLALWAGAMAAFMVFKPLSDQVLGSARSSVSLVAQALVPSAVVVSVQAVLVTIIGQFALGLTAGKLLAVAGLMLLTGLTFVVVNHALAAWFGNAGRLVALGLAILSLASALTSAAPALFGVLRTFSPLTPALDAVRAVITESGAAATNTFLLVGWLLLGLAAGAIAVVRSRTTSFEALLAAHGVSS